MKEIRDYFLNHNPLGRSVKIKSIRYLGGGNHFNFKVSTSKKDFVVRISNSEGLGAGVLFDVPDEFTILKLVEKYKVAPKAFVVDLERFSQPSLIEQHVKGSSYGSFPELNKKRFREALKLIIKINKIKLGPSSFPFRFSYEYYQTNIDGWEKRLEEVKKLGGKNKLMGEFIRASNNIIKQASKILLKNQEILSRSKSTFIYNDIHGENLFWLPKAKRAIFIDWQKVSLGDPSFMPAVFALAFENKVKASREEFFKLVMKKYNKKARIRNFKKLFWLRILEREVANMIWVPWAWLKQGKKLPFKKIGEYDRYNRTKGLIKNFPFK